MEVNHVALHGNSGVSYNLLYRDFKAAKWYGLTPDAFLTLDRPDRANIVAMYEADWRVEALQRHESEQAARRRAKRR